MTTSLNATMAPAYPKIDNVMVSLIVVTAKTKTIAVSTEVISGISLLVFYSYTRNAKSKPLLLGVAMWYSRAREHARSYIREYSEWELSCHCVAVGFSHSSFTVLSNAGPRVLTRIIIRRCYSRYCGIVDRAYFDDFSTEFVYEDRNQGGQPHGPSFHGLCYTVVLYRLCWCSWQLLHACTRFHFHYS